MSPIKRKTTAKKTTAKKATSKKTTRKPVRQTGATHVREDKMRQAKKPGKRVSKTGKVYYEKRANRSDAGKLLGKLNMSEDFRNLCVRRNQDGSTTMYQIHPGQNACPYGGTIKRVLVTSGGGKSSTTVLNGARTTRKKATTAKAKANQNKFAANSKKAHALVKSGKAKDLKAAWAIVRKK